MCLEHTRRRDMGSKRVQKRHQIGLLLVGEVDVKTSIIELHDIPQGVSRTVVEIGSARRQPPQERPLHFADIAAFPGNQSAARIANLAPLPGQRSGCAPDRENKQSGNMEGRRKYSRIMQEYWRACSPRTSRSAVAARRWVPLSLAHGLASR